MKISTKLTPSEEKLLCDEASRRGLTVSELLSKLIAAGDEVERIEGQSQRIEELRFDPTSIKSIMNCAAESDFAEAGKKAGENSANFYLALMKRPCDYSNCFYLLTKELGEHRNWYSYTVKESAERTRLAFLDNNKLGNKWLAFIEGYVASMVKTLLNVEPKTTVEEGKVILEIPKTSRSI